jgi:periplasmic protein CpxP/Spy
MRTKEENRYRLIILVLVLINIAVIATWWVSGLNETERQRPSWSGERGEFRRDFFEQALNLDEVQKALFSELTRDHMEKIRQMNRDVEQLKNEYNEHLVKNQLNQTLSDSLFMAIAEKRASIDTSMVHHFKRLRTLCTPEQNVKFDSLMTNFMWPRERREGNRYRREERQNR